MNTSLKYGGVAAVSLLIGVGIGVGIDAAGGGAITSAEPAKTVSVAPETTPPSPTSATSVVTSPSPAEPPNVAGKWQLTSCDLQLFTQGNQSTLVAALKLFNTGNVPADVTVTLKWDALPGPPIDGGTKTVTNLQPGASREVNFVKKGVSGNDVTRLQSSSGYQSSNDQKFCIAKTSISEAT